MPRTNFMADSEPMTGTLYTQSVEEKHLNDLATSRT